MAAGLSREAVHSQLAAAIDVVIHLGRDAAGRRSVGQLAVVQRGGDGIVSCVPALSFDGETTTHGPGAQRLREVLG